MSGDERRMIRGEGGRVRRRRFDLRVLHGYPMIGIENEWNRESGQLGGCGVAVQRV